VCCVNLNILARCQVPTTSYSTEINLTTEIFWVCLFPQKIFFFSLNPNPNPTHLPKHESLSPNHQFSQRTWYVEYYSVHAHLVWSQKFRKSAISLDIGLYWYDKSRVFSLLGVGCVSFCLLSGLFYIFSPPRNSPKYSWHWTQSEKRLLQST